MKKKKKTENRENRQARTQGAKMERMENGTDRGHETELLPRTTEAD